MLYNQIRPHLICKMSTPENKDINYFTDKNQFLSTL